MDKNNSLIDNYINQFPKEVRDKLIELNNLIKEIVPDATEKFSYGMPTYYYYKNLVHFAVNKNHIGFYPTPSGVSYFLSLSDKYPSSKGAIRFDIKNELPLDIIRKVIEFRKMENYNMYETNKKG